MLEFMLKPHSVTYMLSLRSLAKVGVYATVSPFSGDLLGDSRMSNVLDKSFIHRSYPKLAYGSIHRLTKNICKSIWNFLI